MSKQYIAKLVEGNVYFLGDKRFDYGAEALVNEQEKIHLEEHAINRVGTTNGKVLFEQKFEFEEVSEEVAAEVAAGKPLEEAKKPKAPANRSRPKAEGSEA